MSQPVAPSTRRRISDNNLKKEHERRIDLMHHESHFNFIKIHLVTHCSDHRHQLGNIPMYSTEVGELAHKGDI